MDGKVGGKRFRFIDPHAEAYSAADAKKQFQELLRTGAKSRKLRTIMAGDFNSDPKDKEPNAYKAVIKAGFSDTSKRRATCCQNETVDNAKSLLSQWIDHIVVRRKSKFKVLKTLVVGNKPGDKIGGHWPSDHAGIVARLRIK
jgi:endonuclease/exonuclease/phosphatase family metal-dependent hydrolase